MEYLPLNTVQVILKTSSVCVHLLVCVDYEHRGYNNVWQLKSNQ